ncbi:MULTISPECIES: hypothetical protein [Micromonospora]|uniref:Tissue inhibitor of metalloproteinase n=1 Tax=Micromonospora chalcea TaxID=1874 RepID=A0ABX9Y9N6_MICCH|nr:MULTISPECIES: hypothetical protein [Micromonospora]ODB81511.1 hypothetical protein A8711_16080 [Micromonospora sp. II]RQW95055.1 hypothetical protein DLJ60_07785 [Micromonospora chalcea]RQX59896.1 hypothetical protein DLJ57_00615 [Micromonospora chalcea]WBB85910.1 hypothetical protein O7542_01810 [Micromonospora sp. WMMC264]
MRLRALLVVALAALGLVVVMSPPKPAWACSCVGSTTEQDANADSTVVGTVSQVTDRAIRLTVESVEKGGAQVGNSLTLRVSPGEAACGYAFRLGTRYRVNSYGGATGVCAGIRELSSPAAATTPSVATAERTRAAGPPAWWIVGGVTVAALAVAGLVVAARRRTGRGQP